MKKIFNNAGQTLVELLITIGLAAILLPALLGAFFVTRNGRVQIDQRINATSYLKEAQEAVRIIQANGWTNFVSSPNPYHPVVSATTWALSNGSESVAGFTRSIIISDVNRNSSGDIVLTGGTSDPSTKKITITVSWLTPIPSSVSSVSYLTRHKNIVKDYTTIADFTPGVLTNTTVTATQNTGIPNDGQIQLGAGGGAGGGDWCKPAQYVLKTANLPGQGVAQSLSATSTATQNVAYTTTGGNASGDAVDGLTVSFANPPLATVAASNNEAKAYGIFVESGGNYVYFNENNPPNHTVRIVKASDLTATGYFDVNGKTGSSVYVLGNTGFTVSGSTLYSFDVSSKTGSRPLLGSVALAGNGKRVFVVGTNAYVATDNTTKQLQIINVTNPAAMTVTKSLNMGNSQPGVDVYIDSTQTFAYLVTTYAVGKNDFFIINLNNTTVVYPYSTNGMNPKGITVVPRNRAIIVGSGTGNLYQVFDTTTQSDATNCGGMTPANVTAINSVASVVQPDGKVFSYILTDDSSNEFQIILGGPGSGQFATSGTYTSSPLQVTNPTFFNRFTATISEPASTTISLQVAVATVVNNSCTGATYTYVGPDGTAGTFFSPSGNTITAQIPLTGSGSYVNPGQCFSYKVSFSSNDSTLTPILYDTIINYSP